MNVTVFQSYVYANFLGLYLLILGLIFITRCDYYTILLRSVKLTPFNMVITGFLTIFFGLFLIEHHNVWILKPRLLLTLLSWWILIKGLLIVLFPEFMIDLYYRCMTPRRVFFGSILCIILGMIMVFDGARLLHQVQFLPQS